MIEAIFKKACEEVEDGFLVFKENSDYYLLFPDDLMDQAEQLPHLNRCGETSLFCLNFGNHVGLFSLAGIQIKVKSKKITELQFMQLLDEIGDFFANLPFSYRGASFGFRKGREIGSDVLYQNFMYLYSHLKSKRIQGAVYQIINNPYLKYERERVLKRTEQVRRGGYGTIKEIVNHPEHLVQLAAGSELQNTQLAKKLRGRFPDRVYSKRLFSQVDNPENQFCKFVLQTWQDLIRCLNERTTNVLIKERIEWAFKELNRLLRLEFFQGISQLKFIPFSSQVLQKRGGYKELFAIYNRLSQLLEIDRILDWQSLIELKDAAKLYEYWTFIKLSKAVENAIGKPIDLIEPRTTSFEAQLTHGLGIEYPENVNLYYNKTYRHGRSFGQSYSVTLIPDLVLETDAGFYIFDAKFRLDQLVESESEIYGVFKNEDIYKMHTYRDAIRGCLGAYVLYPGTETRIFSIHNDSKLNGVGAIACAIDSPNDDLKEMVQNMVE